MSTLQEHLRAMGKTHDDFTLAHEAADRLDELEREVEALRKERDRTGWQINRYVAILSGIHSLMYPPLVSFPDGRKFEFRPTGIDPHQVLQELSDRIRKLPDELAAIDAARSKT